ncbi:MAG: hypothetical protein ACPHCV_04030 [Pseudohongiellaceae bacterium]
MRTHKRKAFAITGGIKWALWIANLLASMSAILVIGQPNLSAAVANSTAASIGLCAWQN